MVKLYTLLARTVYKYKGQMCPWLVTEKISQIKKKVITEVKTELKYIIIDLVILYIARE